MYRTAGEEVAAQVVAGRLGVLLTRSDEDAEEGLALVREAAEVLDRLGDAQQRAAAHDRVALALLHRERWADALAALDRVPADAGGDRYLAARIALHRAHLLEQSDRVDEARAAADEARRIGRELGVGELVTGPAWRTRGWSTTRPTRWPPATRHWRLAPADAELPVRVARARALLAAGRAADAVDDFVEAVTLCVERGAEGDAFLRWELANAYRMVGRLAEAAEVAEEAVLGLDRLGAQAEADRCRHLLAGVYAGLGEIDPALALLEQLAEQPGRTGQPPAPGAGAGGGRRHPLRRRPGRGGAERFAAAATAYRLGGLPLDELRARRREAYAWFWADDRDAALRAVEVVDGLAAKLAGQAEPPVHVRAGAGGRGRARVLTGRRPAGRGAGAGSPGCRDQLRSIEAFGEAAQVEALIGELLLRLDRPAEAEPLLRRVLGGLPADSRPVRQTAWLLARALDLLDRPAEAAALRTEHDLDPDDD